MGFSLPKGHHVGYTSTYDNEITAKEAVYSLLHDREVETQTQRVCIPEAALARHSYLVGATGYGKSELIKCLIHAQLASKRSSLVIIDPSGDFAEQVASLKEFLDNDRLVYFKPTLRKGYTPTINPFEISGVDPSDTGEEAVQAKQVVAQQILEAFELMIAGGSGSQVSLPMRAILMPCILTLMDKPGATLLDLQRFMLDGKNHDLIYLGTTRTHYPAVAPFFETQFADKRFNITKGSIATKLQDLFNSGIFVDLTCGPTTVDLFKEIRRRKVIVFNLAKQDIGPLERQSMGRLVVSTVLGIAMRRAAMKLPRVPIHFVIDECHNFVTPSIREIMLEQRKFRLHLFLSQQLVGDQMPADIKSAVTGSCNVQITGYQHRAHQRDAAQLLGVETTDIAKLKIGQFLMSMNGWPAIRFRGRTDLLGHAHSMSPKAWKLTEMRQIRQYYREKVAPEPVRNHRPVDDDPDAPW